MRNYTTPEKSSKRSPSRDVRAHKSPCLPIDALLLHTANTPAKNRSTFTAAESTVCCVSSRAMTLVSVAAVTLIVWLFGKSMLCETFHVLSANSCRGEGELASNAPSSTFKWLRGSLNGNSVSPPDLPSDFDWRAYLKWNPELELQGIHTRRVAEEHYVAEGHLKSLVYRDFELTIRYTACGGLMNQHYCHIATIALAHLAKAKKIIWPPMQERKSFHIRYHPDAKRNEQHWEYLDATTLWDLPKIRKAVKREYGINIVQHPVDVPMPDMTRLETAFQVYDPEENPHDATTYESKMRLHKPIYMAGHNPHMLARSVMDAGRQVVLKHGKQPKSVVVDLPCTLFMLDNRQLPIVEHVARLLTFSPRITELADKVVQGIAREEGADEFNGIHLRMERDAADWAEVLGGKESYWGQYRDVMIQAKFSKDVPLYVASGLLTGSTDINDKSSNSGDPESVAEMRRLAKDIIDNELASKVVHKEIYLDTKELASLSKEQSGLVDFLVLRKSLHMVGISVSTFSFYLRELRLLDGHAQEDTVLFDAYIIGTEQMFHTSAIVAMETREALLRHNMLQNTCKRRSGKPC